MWQLDWSKLAEVLTYNAKQPMIFSSGLFLFLFLGFSLIYMLLQKKDTARILFVTLFSYYFYYKSSGFYFFLLGVVTVTDFLLAGRMANTETQWKRRVLLLASLGINLGLLCYFKYTNFFYQILAPLWNGKFQPLDIFLPVGISFFTFQSLSYTIDVYRRELVPLNRLLDYTFYVSFFPQLVAGPIVRARDFIPQIRQPLFVSSEMFGTGVFFIISGLFKKAVISDYISVNFVERIFDNPALYSGVENLFGVYGYALQIYCDFSGYSDMAIGFALLLGFRFPMNFNSPYKADSITDFWHRWHISLSTWLRDYLYISLGGNRKGKVRTYINLCLTMLLGGLWHGACLFLRRIDGNAPHTPFQIPCLFAEQTFSPIQLVPFHRHQLFILQRLPQRRNALPQHTAFLRISVPHLLHIHLSVAPFRQIFSVNRDSTRMFCKSQV